MRLPGYPKYRESSVEWLGDLPEHWDTPPLYSRYRIELGKMLDESRITGKHLIPYLRNVDVQWDAINTDKLPEMDIRAHEYERYTLAKGDLLVCEGGEVGRAAIFSANGDTVGFQKALHRLRPSRASEDPRFMFYTLYWASHHGVFLAEGKGNEDLENWLVRLLEPRLHIRFDELAYEGKPVVLLEIPRASGRPIQFQGVEFIRIGS